MLPLCADKKKNLTTSSQKRKKSHVQNALLVQTAPEVLELFIHQGSLFTLSSSKKVKNTNQQTSLLKPHFG